MSFILSLSLAKQTAVFGREFHYHSVELLLNLLSLLNWVMMLPLPLYYNISSELHTVRTHIHHELPLGHTHTNTGTQISCQTLIISNTHRLREPLLHASHVWFVLFMPHV